MLQVASSIRQVSWQFSNFNLLKCLDQKKCHLSFLFKKKKVENCQHTSNIISLKTVTTDKYSVTFYFFYLGLARYCCTLVTLERPPLPIFQYRSIHLLYQVYVLCPKPLPQDFQEPQILSYDLFTPPSFCSSEGSGRGDDAVSPRVVCIIQV